MLAARQHTVSVVGRLALALLLASAGLDARGEDAFQAAPMEVPEGFTVDVAAAPPLVQHPLMAHLDDRGRLYIAESAGENLRREDLEKRLPNFVRRLEDTDGDGRYDKSTIFADQLTLPQGALWHQGALYVAAPPSIWRFEDTDDDGVADRRQELVNAFGYTGNAASIHGCFLGPTGRLYWCDGRHGHEVRKSDGTLTSSGKAARIFSCLPDGSDFRVHCGGGMDNPVEVDFTSAGEMLGTVNLFYRQRGDCLVHWVHGGVYPRFDQPDCLDEFPKTGDLLREVHNLGHVAVSGATRLRSRQLGAEYLDSWMITEFNTHKVMRASLQRSGATFAAELSEFLRSSSDDFHPTDVLEDADGSLLVIDTGGWFRIGCPTSQIAKPNIKGAIYRIRRQDAEPLEDPRGSAIAWGELTSSELIELLGDDRHVVRRRAVEQLAGRGDDVVAAVRTAALESSEVRVRQQCVWALAQTGSAESRSALREAVQLGDDAAPVAAAAAFALGQLLPDLSDVDALAQALAANDMPLRRAAAETLGKIRDPRAAEPLLQALSQPVDRVLEHSLIYALIEIGRPASIVSGLSHASPAVRRGALLALDQLQWDGLTQELVAPLLDTEDFSLRAAALEVIGKHPQWDEPTAELLASLLKKRELSPEERSLVRGALLALGSRPAIEPLAAAALLAADRAEADRVMLLDVAARADPLPESWSSGVERHLEASATDVLRQAVMAARQHNATGRYDKPLLRIALDADRAAPLRVASALALAREDRPLEEPLLAFLGRQLREQDNPVVRIDAARALGASPLSKSQVLQLAEWSAEAGPLELPLLLPALTRHADSQTGQALLTALRHSPGTASLAVSQLEEALEPFPAAVREAARPLVDARRAAARDRQQRLAELEQQWRDGDPQQGRLVFHGRAAGCAACHRVDQQGGQVGPDLSKIGQRRSRRDLLEAILYPSASQARGFESYLLRLDDGRQLSGIITRQSAAQLHVRTTDQRELALPRDSIEAMRPATVSVMPEGLQQTISRQQLQDLVAFLESLE